ncbi:MAG: beta-ketoacyl synthase N-terminal-like domain-containing protein [Bacteroidales bacterium]
MRVVITGLAFRTPLGCTIEEAMANIESGTRRIARVENIDLVTEGFNGAGEVRHRGKVIKSDHTIDRKIQFFEESLKELESSTSLHSRYSPNDIVLNIGSGIDYIDIEAIFKERESVFKEKRGEKVFFKSFEQISNIALKSPILGGINLFTAACVASTQAIGSSYRMIKEGYRKAAITGGSDSMVNHINYRGFQDLGAMTPPSNPPFACRPFDKERNGTALGEGALLMLLEESSQANPNSILGEIAGYGTTMDSYAITDPDPSAIPLSKAIKKALAEAQITPQKIDAVHLHGTGTAKNAPAEYRALQIVFGERVSTLPVFALKGQIGHLIGSCGAVEMLAVIHSLQNQVTLPTVNFTTPDPEAPLFVVREKPLR